MYDNRDNRDYSVHDNRLSHFSISPNTNYHITAQSVHSTIYSAQPYFQDKNIGGYVVMWFSTRQASSWRQELLK